MSLAALPLHELLPRLESREITAAEVLEAVIAQIEAQDGELGAFVDFDPQAARHALSETALDAPLRGLPIGIKDNINVRDEPCSCGSRFLHQSYRSPYDATVITRLRAQGGLPLGRLNMDEFAMGSTTEHSALQKTRNPHSPAHIPGGSSGGSAAAVGAGLLPATLGSDTGGSIRQPASHCGVVGLKPTYGRFSRYGLVAFGSSLDQIGPLTRDVTDAALLFDLLAGADPRDATSRPEPLEPTQPTLGESPQGLRIGLPTEYFSAEMAPEIRQALTDLTTQLTAAGVEVEEISLPHSEHAVATYYILAPAEASANLARFDGVRYGHRTAEPADLLELYENSREEGFGSEVKRRIILGTYVLSSGYYDAYYRRAQQARVLIARDFEQAFQKVDLILSPVAPEVAPRFGGAAGNPLSEYLSDLFTIPANLAGLPALSVPLGSASRDGAQLPFGVQLIGPALGEAQLLRLGRAIEQLRP